MLHRYHGLYKLKVCSNPGLTKSASFFHQSAYFVSYVSCLTVNIFNFYIVIFIMIVYDQSSLMSLLQHTEGSDDG